MTVVPNKAYRDLEKRLVDEAEKQLIERARHDPDLSRYLVAKGVIPDCNHENSRGIGLGYAVCNDCGILMPDKLPAHQRE